MSSLLVRVRRAALTPVALVLLLAGVCGGPADASSADGSPAVAAAPAVTPPASPRVKVTKTVRLTRSQTRSVQRRVGVRPDGAIGARTRSAIRRYQSRKKLMRTGRPNIQTLRAMGLKLAERIAARMAAKTAAAPVGGTTFPIQGPWRWGSTATTFGARGGAHQGVDMFAACGTPLVAASAGVVKTRKFETRAGNYVVLTGTPMGEDQVYMHLEAPSPLGVGDAVAPGTVVGKVGDTGDADGCHLHFELWSAPGWYEGGSPRDPTADLTAWSSAAGNAPPAAAR